MEVIDVIDEIETNNNPEVIDVIDEIETNNNPFIDGLDYYMDIIIWIVL